MGMRLVIRQEVRDEAERKAMDAAFEANQRREVNYTTEILIKAAIEGAINFLETKLG